MHAPILGVFFVKANPHFSHKNRAWAKNAIDRADGLCYTKTIERQGTERQE